ncbi:MAG: TIM barrel protein [Microbacterium sp.]|uniref:sugar phosphate isomerase/epimerase family protein n=1 Tax=Microbacterium sp. TaxID=51671 RepID=UPI0025D4A262|nr:TIM barrel protein [Microbacterium sp.]MBQ9916167.1 TIM barrel protein [Microbacterium sp.]
MKRSLGVAHLTLLSLTPPELVTTAAAAGFDFVGLRVRAVTATERAFPMHAGSPMLRETIARMDDTGVIVRDIEFLPITPTTTRSDWLAALESGAALGATALTVTGADPDRSRLLDTLTQLTADAAGYGIRPVLEPISYQPVSRVADAAAVARAARAAIMLDPLHVHRGGSTLDEIRALEPDLVPVVQLCDAPLEAPTGPDRVAALQREARVQRLLVGEGALPLAELLDATPAGTPVSVEIPHAELQARWSPLEYATLAARSARALIDRVDEARDTAAA